MSVCILGIFLFQGYWLYNSYKLREEQFSKEINESLRMAVFNKQFSDVRRYIKYFGKDKDSLKRPMRGLAEQVEEIGMPKGRRFKVQRDTDRYPGPPPPEAFHGDSPSRVYADTLARQISEYLITSTLHNDSTNLIKLDSVFRVELANRQIATSYQLDTIHLNYSGFERESFRDSIRRREPRQTSKIPFNPASNLFVQATFDSPLQFILQKMIWTLLSSLLLLVLTTLCFVYMLRTILKQNDCRR